MDNKHRIENQKKKKRLDVKLLGPCNQIGTQEIHFLNKAIHSSKYNKKVTLQLLSGNDRDQQLPSIKITN